MITVVFPPDEQRLAPLNAPQKRLMYPVILADIIRAASDSIDALSLFGDLITGRRTDPESVGYMAFDGHIGDTSCQLRACMLRDLVVYHRSLLQETPFPTEYPNWLAGTIYSLQELIEKAKSTCLQLTKGRGVTPQKIGLGNLTETRTAMLQKLGWVEPTFEIGTGIESAGEYDCPDFDCGASETETESSAASTPTIDSSDRTPVTAPAMSEYGNTHAGGSRDPIQGGAGTGEDLSCPGPFLDLGAVDRKLAESASQMHNASNLSHESPSTESKPMWLSWSLTDMGTIVRFLTYNYTLSKYKRFAPRRVRDSNPSSSSTSRLVSRLEPEIATSYGSSLLADVYDSKNPHYTGAEKALKTSQRIHIEFQAAQSWVSELSCAWLARTAENLGNWELRRLLAETIRTSVKGLVSVPSYVGYLVLREHWARNLIPNLIVDRRFCKDGFHINYFLARPHITTGRDNIGNPHATLGLSVRWTLQHITDSSAAELSQDHDTPYIVITGNSLNGSFAAYMDRLEHACEHSGPCEDNSTHIEQFLASDQDRLTLAIFADHPHYAFPLGPDEEKLGGAIPVVAAAMGKIIPGLEAQWQKSKDEVVELGAGDSLKMFMWQHVLLETAGKVMRMLKGRTSTMPLSAAV